LKKTNFKATRKRSLEQLDLETSDPGGQPKLKRTASKRMEESILNLIMIMLWGLLLLFTATPVTGFSPATVIPQQRVTTAARPTYLRAAEKDKEEDEEKPENPYADPNYPDLEFVNYDDPEYQVDQGTGDEFFDADSTEAQIEAMREDRRRRNDECK
jgi:hypothetical protein